MEIKCLSWNVVTVEVHCTKDIQQLFLKVNLKARREK